MTKPCLATATGPTGPADSFKENCLGISNIQCKKFYIDKTDHDSMTIKIFMIILEKTLQWKFHF